LRESAGARQLTYIATSSAEQTRILEETKNLTIKISKEQAMGLITEANRAYDGVVKKATEKKNKIIQEAIKIMNGKKNFLYKKEKKRYLMSYK